MNALSKLTSLLVLGLLLAMGSAANAAQLPDFREIVRENSPAVVKIIVESSSHQEGEKLLKEGCQIVEEALRGSK